MKQNNISAVIIAKNEQEVIGECIESLKWCDEIIVIDSKSTDKTTTIAKEKGATVFIHDFADFSTQRTVGQEIATGEWILYIDADERVSDELKREIINLIESPKEHAYKLKRKNYYMGKEWPGEEYLERLFIKKYLKGWRGLVHETPIVDGSIGALEGPLYHYTHRTLEAMLQKTIIWSSVEANLIYKSNHPPITWWRLIRVSKTGFFRSYISQKGYSVGTIGLIESIYQGFSMFITYAKVWELQNHEKQNHHHS